MAIAISGAPRVAAALSLVFVVTAGSVVGAGACAPPPMTPPGKEHAVEGAEEQFDHFSQRFVAEWLAQNPVAATQAGDHARDGLWPRLDESSEREERERLVRLRADLAGIRGRRLDEARRIDAEIAENVIARALYTIDEERRWENDPLAVSYLVGDGLDPLVTRDFAPAAQRYAALKQRLEGLPRLLDEARLRLRRPPRIRTETAVAQIRGLVAFCRDDVPAQAKAAGIPEDAIGPAAATGQAALERFAQFLETELLARSDGDFRLGREPFERKLALELDDTIAAEELERGARKLLTETQDAMVGTTEKLWPELFGEAMPAATDRAARLDLVRRALAKVSETRPTNATIVDDSRKILAQATAFVREHDLVRVPDEPCEIIEMPEYRRGVAIAYCDSSGPLEEKQQTFFAIAPTPSDWSPERAESFYREYNTGMLADLTVHEAMPGHFLQLMHNNRYPSRLRALYSSGSFVEGWAVYAEWLMADHGFGGARVQLNRQKMVLRLAANAVLDAQTHAGQLDQKGALALLMGEAFQEEGEAVGKWKRAQLTSTQLSTYYFGFTRMMELRARAEKDARFRKPGGAFDERKYNDLLLSFGSPPPRHLGPLLGL